ncbi:ABC transporter permease subunit [Candidatus Poriferisocius sp.]|uniref:ABC transporter permease subunit n=1 Tax=Candidatus Poriferisocius sp. TaxID=3101276 RepID=UPI003B5AB4CD
MSSTAEVTGTPADLTAVPSAPLKRRAQALIADLMILAIVAVISVWQFGLRLLDGYSDVAELLLAWLFVAAIPAAILSLMLTDAVRIGQTPGMALLGIRVVHDGSARRAVPTSDPRVPLPGIPALWRDVRVLRIAGQVLVAVAVIAALRLLFHNLVTGMDETGISRDFDVLQRPTNFEIRDANFDLRNPIWKGILAGIKNTALVSVVGIFMASLIGLFVGIARLSSNKLVAWLATLYVETLRNIPPLVVIMFFGFALFTFGPLPAWAISRGQFPWEGRWPGSDSNYLIISKDRWGIPSLASSGNVGLFWVLVLVAAITAIAVGIWRTRRNTATGIPHHRMLWSLAVFTLVVVVSFVALGGPYDWSWPAVSDSGRRVSGGFATNSGFMALTIALGCYTASFVAEIVRGSILALPRGQGEAASAIGLKSSQQYRFVILPQAMRIAIPPYISECLNLAKNTSLAITVGFFDVTLLVQTAIGNGNPAPQLIGILMAVYLLISLIISLVLNLYNRSIQLKER